MKYEVYGPFYAPRAEAEAKGANLKVFWDEIEAMHEGLPRAVGIYIFSTRYGDNFTPWYVGKTMRKQVSGAKYFKRTSSATMLAQNFASGGIRPSI